MMHRAALLKRVALWTLLWTLFPVLPIAVPDGGGPPILHALEVPSQSGAAEPADSDLFPHKARIRHAQSFTLEYHDTYKIVRVIEPWRGARATFTYVLVPRGQAPPGDISREAVVVEIPLRRVVMASTTILTFFPMLGVEDSLVGLSATELVNTPEVAERIRRGEIEEVGAGGGGMARRINIELLFTLQPDLVLVHGTGIPQYDTHPQLMEAGFKTVMVSNYMEPDPLGRAEWIKFLAAFYNKEEEAEALFSRMEADYRQLAKAVRGAENRPTVFCGIPQQSTWYTPGGRSYMAAFLRDAGAHYLWEDDDSSGFMPMSVENVLERAGDADVWMNPGGVLSMEELRGTDDRFVLFRAFREGRVYNNNARIGPGGGNDYWETGVGRPDLVLADIVKVLHPHLLPDHELIWHHRLPAVSVGD